MKLFLFSISLVLMAFLVSCKKDKNFTKDHLDFSTDTLLFDTVFTTVGSTTQRFKIYNRNLGTIRIDEIELMGGESSPFRINFDGVPGAYHENIEIPGNDSLFGFVEVTLDVNSATYPLVISDSIRFLTNGLNQYLKLDVWGQDAYFHTNELVADEIEMWNNDKPHVLYGIAAVGYPGLDSNLTLTIPAGTQIYAHKNARLIVYKSTLKIEGSLGNEVTFKGDRLENFYDDITGQWWGIQLIEAEASSINYAVIRNAVIGIGVYETPLGDFTLTNSIINNSNFFNLHVSDGGRLDNVENCLFGDAGTSSVFLEQCGYFRIRQCNFVNYWNGGRNGPALAIRNWKILADETLELVNVIDSRIDNCIIYGNSADEFVVDTISFEGLTFEVTFNSSLIRREEIYAYPNYTPSISWNLDPLFVDPALKDYHLQDGSPLKDAGDPLFSTPLDIEGTPRGGSPAIGLYEL